MVTASPVAVGAWEELARLDVPVIMVELSDESVAEAEDSVLVADSVLEVGLAVTAAEEESALVLAGVVLVLSTANGGVKLVSDESLSATISTV